MSEYEVTSPPFATSLCTPTILHRQLEKLSVWVDDLRYWANEEAERFEAPETPFVPDTRKVPANPEALMGIAGPSVVRTWMTLRAIR